MSGTVTYSYTILNNPIDPRFRVNQLPPDNWQDNNGAPCAWNVTGLPTGYPVYVSGGLPCDWTPQSQGTVYVSSSDAVCSAQLTYTISGTGQFDQTVTQGIMNVPYEDAVRTQAYFQYIVNNQVAQITGSAPASLTKES